MFFSGHKGKHFHIQGKDIEQIRGSRDDTDERLSLDVLLEVFVKFHEARLTPVNQKQIRVLHPCKGSTVFDCAHSTNGGKVKAKKDIQRFGTFQPGGFAPQATGLSSISVIGDSEELNFCRWIDRVLDGTINTDEVTSFVSEVCASLDGMTAPANSDAEFSLAETEWLEFIQKDRPELEKTIVAAASKPVQAVAQRVDHIHEIVEAPLLLRYLIPDADMNEAMKFLEDNHIVTGYVVDKLALNSLMLEHEAKTSSTECSPSTKSSPPSKIQKLLEFPKLLELKHGELKASSDAFSMNTPKKEQKKSLKRGNGPTPTKYFEQLSNGMKKGQLLLTLETLGIDWNQAVARGDMTPVKFNVNERDGNGDLTRKAKQTRSVIADSIKKQNQNAKRQRTSSDTPDMSSPQS